VIGKTNMTLGFITLCSVGDIGVISSCSAHFSTRNRKLQDDSEKSHGVIWSLESLPHSDRLKELNLFIFLKRR